ncbi:MAG: AgmX/PglI C-terminal domain-containing protein [bacterium]
MKEAEKNPHSVKKNNFDFSKSGQDLFESKIIEFPQEFRKSLLDRIDQRFFAVLIGSFILHFALVTYFLLNPPPKEKTYSRIAKIQERLAKALKQREMAMETQFAKFEFTEKKPDVEKEEFEKESSETKLAKKSTAKGKASKKTRRQTLRRGKRSSGGGKVKSQEEIADAIGSKGILALLTSTSSIASGEEVEDILGLSGESQQDLDKVLSSLSGIKSSGKPTEGKGGPGIGSAYVKGGRAEGGGGIDDLVSNLGSTKSNSFERSGELVVVSESPLIEGGGKKGIVGRNQDDIQAVVLKHKHGIQYCYERELKRNPNLKGKLVVRFTITSQGIVKSVKIVSSTLNNRKVEQCVIRRIRRWNDFGFNDPSFGDTTIRQAFAFGY